MSSERINKVDDHSHMSFCKTEKVTKERSIKHAFGRQIHHSDQIVELLSSEKDSSSWKIVIMLDSA